MDGFTKAAEPFNGRDSRGRFCPGTRPGPGRPRGSGRAARLRESMLAAIRVGDARAVVKALVAEAKQGRVAAAKLLVEVIKQHELVEIEQRLAHLEEQICRRD